MIETDVLIVGGGLAGLRLADLLWNAKIDFQLIEARNRFGGRVLSLLQEGNAFDLGPAWFWPGQPRMAALADRFGLQVFEQWSRGDFRFEDAQGNIRQGQGMAAMQGSLRLSGGMAALTDALVSTLPPDRLHLSRPLKTLRLTHDSIQAETAGALFGAKRVVLALPPRLAAGIKFIPALPPEALLTMSNIPTWMAGQAKALALYDRPFWREAGLSGDAMSQRGPLVEIHDASPFIGGPYALFGFIGVPPAHRSDQASLETGIASQLRRLFGPDTPNPHAIDIQDWATEVTTATDQDATPLAGHPRYGMPSALRNLWGSKLSLAGTECAEEFGGFLEGALEAAESSFAQLSNAAESV